MSFSAIVYRLMLCWLCLLFIPLIAQSQTKPSPPRTSAHRITQDITIDGRLDEPAWQNAEPIRQLLQIQPNEGEPMTQPSEVRILYDTKKLYFGFIFFDSEIDKLVANEMRRDSTGLRSNDYGFLLLYHINVIFLVYLFFRYVIMNK
ncbi:MAG: hypothetical protein OXU23_25385 [Candidatus Poribacteria bacterium]|nr:hypothetical protein [Candidatus Poribacteria bacterium]